MRTLRASRVALAVLATSWAVAQAAQTPRAKRPATRPAIKLRKNLAPLPLKLPRPTAVPTPRNLPPGTRVKIPKDKWKPRKPFYAPKGVTNVALNKPVTSSDPEPLIGTLDLVTDGESEFHDGAFVELGFGVQYVQIDLGKAHAIHAIVLWHEFRDPRVYHDVIVQVANDKDFLTNVRTLHNSDHDNSAGLGIGKDWGYFETNEGLLVDAKGVKARYVRLTSNGSTGDDLNRYTEVAVFGLKAK